MVKVSPVDKCDSTWTNNFFSCDGIFANPEEGLNYQHKEPEYPAPEELKSEKELKESMLNFVPENARTSFMRERHVEIRPTRPVNPFQPQPEAPFYAHYISHP